MKWHGLVLLALAAWIAGIDGYAQGVQSDQDERMTLQIGGMSVSDALRLVGTALDRNVIVGPGVEGSVDLSVEAIRPADAWAALLRAHRLTARRSGSVWWVVPAPPARAEVRLVTVSHANAGALADLLRSAYADGEAVRIQADTRSNQLLVSGQDDAVSSVAHLARSLDKPSRQILLKSRVVIAQSSEFERLGIAWQGQLRNETSPIPGNWSAWHTDPGSSRSDHRAPRGIFASLATSLGDPEGGGAAANLGVIRNGSVLALELEALEGSGDLEIVSQPEMMTSDGYEAQIASGSSIPFPGPEGSTEFVDALLSLSATPRVAGNSEIILALRVRQDSPTGGGSDNISTNSLTTRVRVQSGETLVLGGVFRQESAQETLAVPGLSRLPWIGTLFQRTTERDVRHELMIFITPTLVG